MSAIVQRSCGTVPAPPVASLKLIVVGATATGKSNFLHYWKTNTVATKLIRGTIAVDFHEKEMHIQMPPPPPKDASVRIQVPPASIRVSTPARLDTASALPSVATTSRGNHKDVSFPIDEDEDGLCEVEMKTIFSSVVDLFPMRTGTAVTTTTSRQSDADAPSESRSTFGFGDSSGEGSASRKDFTPSFKIVAPSPADFGPQSETIPTLVQVWDVSGEERVKNLTRIFYHSAMGALVFCDVKSAKSLEDAAQWKADIDTKVFVSVADPNAPPTAPPPAQVRTFRLSSNPSAPPPAAAKIDKKIPCWLVINKCDLLSHSDPPAPLCMTTDHLDHFVKEHGFVGWCYASGMKGTNVHETVASLLSHVVKAFPDEVWKRSADSTTTENIARPVRLKKPRILQDDAKRSRCAQ